MSSVLHSIKIKGDKTIWLIVFALSLFSIMVVYSAAGWAHLTSHILKLFIGLIGMYIVHHIPFKYFSRLGQIGYYTSLVLLLMVLVIGVSINGASRWVSVAGLQFQPSDVAKLTVILFMARQISIHRDRLGSFIQISWYVFLPLLAVCSLILPNNFSTAALVFINGLVLMYIGRIKLNFIAKILASAFIVAGVIYGLSKFMPEFGVKILPRSTTWVSRIDSYFLNNSAEIMDKDYQQTQSLVAIQNGSLFGVGPGKSTQRSILPYSESDFIYTV